MRRYHYGYGWQVSRRALSRLFWMIVLLALAVLLAISMLRMRALLGRMAISKATNVVNQIVIESVNESIENGDFKYAHLVSFEKDTDGKITAVKSNMPEFNRLQAKILDSILKRVSNVSTRDLSIPVGSLTGSMLLAGRGPAITVKMQSVGSSAARLENQFVSAGINQTKHQILLNVDVYVSILLPGLAKATKVSNSFVVAETVIVGSVPHGYTYFSSGSTGNRDIKNYILKKR